MKKILFACLIICLVLAMGGCSSGGRKDNPNNPPNAPNVIIKQSTHTISGVTFYMRLAPGGLTFPTGLNNNSDTTVENAFWIAKTPVTYELWYEVYTWATHEDRGVNRYYFAGAGREGSQGTIGQAPTVKKNEPVTCICWWDVMVWCNALTEYYNDQHEANWSCVYTDGGSNVVRDSRSSNSDVCNNVTKDRTARGFRLPSSNEWEMAARYIGPTRPNREPLRTEAIFKDNFYWTPGNYASGATANHNDPSATKKAAWHSSNSTDSKDVGQKPDNGTEPVGNGLGLYDMSGNVWEWCFDWHPSYVGTYRVSRGGSWLNASGDLSVGFVSFLDPSSTHSSSHYDRGFRIVRTE